MKHVLTIVRTLPELQSLIKQVNALGYYISGTECYSGKLYPAPAWILTTIDQVRWPMEVWPHPLCLHRGLRFQYDIKGLADSLFAKGDTYIQVRPGAFIPTMILFGFPVKRRSQ